MLGMHTSMARTSLLVLGYTAVGCASVTPNITSTNEQPTRAADYALQSSESAHPAGGPSDAEAAAKALANPVAAMISVPLQLNFDEDIGPSDGERWTLNVQPVVPISLNEDWNVISRTIVPIIDQDDIPAGEDESGVGDVTQSFFVSPVEPTKSGWIWGAGPVLLIPTASDESLGTEQWGIGPTAVFLKQEGAWTYGALMNHIWSFTGEDDRADVNSTFVQPFLAHTTKTAVTYTLNAESTYDWEADQLALPVNALVTRVFKWGGQLVSVGGGLRYWVEDSDASPEGLGFRFVFTFLLPK
jgi:hypothetical protein